MILQNDYWFDIVPARDDRNERSDGKWLHFGPTSELHSWLQRLDGLVEGGRLRAAKVARKLPGIDPFPNKPCVLCVFTADNARSKEDARSVLKAEFGIDVTLWKSDEQTRRDWQPGGWLHLEYEINQIREQLERDGFDQAGRARLRGMATQLKKAIAQVGEPSRVEELKAARTVELAHQLADELRQPDVSEPSIVARLNEIKIQLDQLMAREQTTVPQAAVAAAREDPDVVFVIMPFADDHIDTLDAIRRGVGRAGPTLRAERVDEVPGAVQITDEVRKAIRKARLIVCDLTKERPNVYYELGLAHGLTKPVICVARKGTVVHFDVYGLKVLFFETYRSLEEQLEREIRALLQKTGAQATAS